MATYYCPVTHDLVTIGSDGKAQHAAPGARPTVGAIFIHPHTGALMRVGANGYPEPAGGAAPAPAAPAGYGYGGAPAGYSYSAAPAAPAGYGAAPTQSFGCGAAPAQSFGYGAAPAPAYGYGAAPAPASYSYSSGGYPTAGGYPALGKW